MMMEDIDSNRLLFNFLLEYIYLIELIGIYNPYQRI